MRSLLMLFVALVPAVGCGRGTDLPAKTGEADPLAARPSVGLAPRTGTEHGPAPSDKSTPHGAPGPDGITFEGGQGHLRFLRDDRVIQVYCLKDGKHFVTIGNTVRLWDLATLTPRTLNTKIRIGSGVFTDSPTHGLLALGVRIPGGEVAVWDVKSGRLLREFRHPQGTPMHLAFIENGNRLLCFADEGKSPKDFTRYKGTVLSWNVREGGLGVEQEFIALPAAIDGPAEKLVFLDGNKLIALDISTPVAAQKPIAHLGSLLNKGKNAAYALAEFSPDLRIRLVFGRMTTPAGNYENFEVWEPALGKRIATFTDPRSITMARAIGIDMVLMAGHGWIDLRSPTGARLAQTPTLFSGTGSTRTKMSNPVVALDSIGLGHPVVAALDNGEVCIWDPGLDELGRKRP